MTDRERLFREIEGKVTRLGRMVNSYSQQIELLQNTVNELRRKNIELESNIKTLKNKFELNKIATHLNSGENKGEIKKRINEMVREIDNCLNLLIE